MEDNKSRPEATFNFEISKIREFFRRTKDFALSEPCYVRNLPWRIIAKPRPGTDGRPKTLGFFVECNGEYDSSNWSCWATVELRLISQRPDRQNVVRRIRQLFFAQRNDWGFPDFYPEKDVLDESRGYCKNDSIILQVSIWADLPLGIRWDSKKSTGYVGLKNKQATCYLNSLLQALYFTNKLRKAVYQMPTESDDSSSSVALALQRVFYQMQFNEEAVNIQEFTSAFDWLSLDLATQYDVHDLCRLLFETLKVKMKNTCLADTIPKLFQGQMFTFICCKHVDFHSTQTEPFYDIQLNVRGNRNIYEAFDEYVSLETLTGEDKYDAGVYGLQEAEKGIMFESFPPVLHLHLLRFEYDPMDGENVKINDRFEFFEQINLSKYLIRRRPDESTIYILHAVLVRLGDYSSEHSLVYINTKGDGNWCKFDDDVVSFCLKEEAIQNNFGDGDDSERGINAYMLVYIRQGSDILEPVTDEMISGELVERLNESENRIQNGHHIQNRNLIENGNHIETISRSRYPKRQRTVP